MRPSALHTLLVFGLLVGGVRISSTLAGPADPARPLPAPPANPTWTEDGYGRTPQDAEEVALKKAQESVTTFLLKQYGDLGGWMPKPESLREAGVVRPEGSPETVQLDGRQVQHVRVRVELTPTYLGQVQEFARAQRIEQRHLVLARVLAGLVVLVVVVAGYLRLEEATRGYYTRLLRLAGVGVLVLAGLALVVLG